MGKKHKIAIICQRYDCLPENTRKRVKLLELIMSKYITVLVENQFIKISNFSL